MAASKGNRQKKGKFGLADLPVSSEYIYPKSRLAFLYAGGIGLVVLAVLFALNAGFSANPLLSNGPLSSNHAAFESDCSTCHTPSNGVPDEKCGTCHEKYGDKLGTHSFDAHYLYRSGDFSRIVPAVNESNCATCHGEHNGRDAVITRVTDATCATCHEIDSFESDHPEFQFAAENLVDESNLIFPHTLHVAELERRERITDVEKTCLYCHNATPDGQGFQPINFDQHCDNCHLTSSTATPFLAIADQRNDKTPGVLTLENIQATQEAGTRWAYYTNPDEFQARGNTIRKRPLYHRDPWILENLRQIRERLYPSSGLADLLRASSDVKPGGEKALYEEAIQTLRLYVEELRNQPDRTIQSELEGAEALLQTVERRLTDPYSARDETQFSISAADVSPDFSAEEVAQFDQFIDELSEPCQTCHVVEQATIQRVTEDQKSLNRADFDHRAHIIQARCVDCHSAIPVEQFVATDSLPPIAVDRAEIHNLPTIANCQSCHNEAQASSTCTTCHAFHPDKSQHANLLLYLD